MNDVAINKVQSIQRCVERVSEIYNRHKQNFTADFDAQDAAILNIIRACDMAIDLANHLTKIYKMGIPTSSAESFDLIMRKQVIGSALADKLKKMVSFRNIAVHEYEKIDCGIVVSIIEKDLQDLITYTKLVVNYAVAHTL